MLRQLYKFHFCHVHQGVDLIFRALEVLDAERVNSYDFHTSLITDFENLVECVRN